MNLSSTMKPRTLGEVRQEPLDFTVKSTPTVGHVNQSTPRNVTYFCRPLASQSSASADTSKIPGSHRDVVKLAGTPQDVSRGVGDIWAKSAWQKTPGFVLRKNLPVTQKPGESASKVYIPQSSQTPDSWNGESTQEILQKSGKYIMKQGTAEYQVSGRYTTPVRKQRAAPEMEFPQCHVADRSPMEFYPYACRDTQQLSLPFSNVPNAPVAIPYSYLYPHFLPYLQLQPFLQRWMKEESLSPMLRGRKYGNISHSNLERDVCCVKPQPRKRNGLTEFRNEERGTELESKLHGFCPKPHVNEESSAGPPYPLRHDLHEEQEVELRPWFDHSMQGDPVRLGSAHPWATQISSFSNTIRQQHQVRSHMLPKKKRSAGFPNNHSGSSSPKKTRKHCTLQKEAVVLEKAGVEIRGKRTEPHCLDYSQKRKNEVQWNRKKPESSKIPESPQMPTSTLENYGSAATPNHWRPPLKRERPPSRSLPNVLIHAGHLDIVDSEISPPTEICNNIEVQRAQEYAPQPEVPGCASRRMGDTSRHCQGPDSNGSLVTSQDSKHHGIRHAEECNQTKTWVPQRKMGLCEQSSDQNLYKEINPRRERLKKPWTPALLNRQKSDIINLSHWKDGELPGEISGSQTQNKSIWQDIHEKDRISTLFDISQMCSEKEDSGEISGSSSQAVSDPSFDGEDGPKYLTLDRGAIFRPKWHGIEAVLETYIKYMEEKKIEEMALQEQLKQSKALNEELNQRVRRLRIQLQELEASKAQLVKDQMLQEAALSCLQKCLVFAV